MEAILWILGGILWYLTGLWSFIWWESTQWDVYLDDISVGWIISIIGPFVFPMGYLVFRPPTIPRTLLRKRRE